MTKDIRRAIVSLQLAFATMALAIVVDPTTVVMAQTQCDSFVDGLKPKSDAVETAIDAVKKLQPGPVQHCAEAKKLADVAVTLARQINDGKAACAGASPQSFAAMRLRQRIAVSDFNATQVDSEVARLCR